MIKLIFYDDLNGKLYLSFYKNHDGAISEFHRLATEEDKKTFALEYASYLKFKESPKILLKPEPAKISPVIETKKETKK